MRSGRVYTDHTTLMYGKYKFYKLHEIPPDYFLNIYANPNGNMDLALVDWVEVNIERIKAKKDGIPLVAEGKVEEIEECTKKQYLTKNFAREALKRIRNSPGDHKKPIRSYECKKCSTWHLTSMPIEVWKNQQVKT